MAVPPGRTEEAARVQRSLVRWSRSRVEVRAIAVVGSWARGGAGPGSDLDVVILGDPLERLTRDDGWITHAVGEPAPVVRRARWGALTERRVRLASGFEVELGLVPLTWAETNPVDPGTSTVVRDGCRILHDADGIVASLLAACA